MSRTHSVFVAVFVAIALLRIGAVIVRSMSEPPAKMDVSACIESWQRQQAEQQKKDIERIIDSYNARPTLQNPTNP